MNKNELPKLISAWAEKNRINHQHHDFIDSTNTFSKNLHFDDLSKAYLVTASLQTAGKGRNSNTWKSESNEGLLSSWNFFLDFTPPPVFSILVGLSLIRSLSEAWPLISFSLKAPNDVYVLDKKIAGLLIENIITQNYNTSENQCHLIIGLGLNIFASPLATSTSILDCDKNFKLNDIKTFLDSFLKSLADILTKLKTNQLQWTSYEAEILSHLNKFKLLNDPYVKLDLDGTLHSKTQVKNWFDL
jgi:BirA family biotin operon repressor/biotin-[acetyl-CoA-carboxylase] ligase